MTPPQDININEILKPIEERIQKLEDVIFPPGGGSILEKIQGSIAVLKNENMEINLRINRSIKILMELKDQVEKSRGTALGM